MNTFAIICNVLSIIVILSILRMLRKRIENLERSDVYHHTRVSFLKNSECDNIQEHNTKEFKENMK